MKMDAGGGNGNGADGTQLATMFVEQLRREDVSTLGTVGSR